MLVRIPITAFFIAVLLSVQSPVTSTYAAFPEQDAPPTQVTTVSDSNLRKGPGTTFDRVGMAPAGMTLKIIGCNSACDWYQIDSGAWIAAFLVNPVTGALAPVALPTPTPSLARPTTNVPSRVVLPTLTPFARASATIAAPSPIPGASAPQVMIETPVAPVTGTVALNAGNLRSGPGTTYSILGSVQANQSLDITGKTSGGDWLQLSNGNWIAAFLVTNAPVDLPNVDVPTPAIVPDVVSEQPAPSSTLTYQDIEEAWDRTSEFGQSYTCGHFEFTVTKAWRTKSLWQYDRDYVAQGEWLLVFVDVKNISPGTSYFGRTSPRLVLTKYGDISAMVDDDKATRYASWMYQHGRFYEDINPGVSLGLVAAYDVPLEPNYLLGLGMMDCENVLISLGTWKNVPLAEKK